MVAKPQATFEEWLGEEVGAYVEDALLIMNDETKKGRLLADPDHVEYTARNIGQAFAIDLERYLRARYCDRNAVPHGASV